jgi:DNA glycosylase AlkZ-like
MRSVTWDDVRARRLARSSVAHRASGERLVETASAPCRVHAQVQTAAELQLAVRVDGITRKDVRDAPWERCSLVKARTVRGTLHLHPAGELSLWHAARRAATGVSQRKPEGLAAWRDPAGVEHALLGPRSSRRPALPSRMFSTGDDCSARTVRTPGRRPLPDDRRCHRGSLGAKGRAAGDKSFTSVPCGG